MTCPVCLILFLASKANLLLKKIITSAAIAPFLVAPKDKQSTPNFHVASAGDMF